MFLSTLEQEEIINKFLNVIEMKTVINNKVSTCKNCKFNQQNMSLYKLNIPSNIVKDICKHNYEECEVCKTLKQFKENVYDCSFEDFENMVKAIEDKQKYNIENHTENKIGNQIYYYIKLNPFPTFEETLRCTQSILNDCISYNIELYNEIKLLYDNSFDVMKEVREFYSKQRIKIIDYYYENVDKNNDTRSNFINYIKSQIGKVESAIKEILSYINKTEKFSNLKFKLYSNEAFKSINMRIGEKIF